MSRTEDQKITQAPIIVTLGGEEHEIRPLVIAESREWRTEVVKLLATLPKYASITTDDPEAFEGGMNALLSSMPDAVIDLFFRYAKDLDRKQLESKANDAEIAEAFSKVVDIAFPLLRSVTTLAEKLSQ